MYQADEKGDNHTLPDNNIPSVENENANKNESNRFLYDREFRNKTFLDNLTGIPSAIASVADDLYNTNYKKAIQLKPNYAEANNNLGIVLKKHRLLLIIKTNKRSN